MQKRILVGDDDQAILDVLRLVLEEGGYAVETVSGEQGMLAKIEPPPDLILLDFRMAGLDGHALCQRLKRDAATKHVPIAMISGSAEAANLAKECGADAFIAKPFDIEDLLDVVAHLINGAESPFIPPSLRGPDQAGADMAP